MDLMRRLLGYVPNAHRNQAAINPVYRQRIQQNPEMRSPRVLRRKRNPAIHYSAFSSVVNRLRMPCTDQLLPETLHHFSPFHRPVVGMFNTHAIVPRINRAIGQGDTARMKMSMNIAIEATETARVDRNVA